MTDDDALTVTGTFVHLPLPWALFGGCLLALPLGAAAALRIHR